MFLQVIKFIVARIKFIGVKIPFNTVVDLNNKFDENVEIGHYSKIGNTEWGRYSYCGRFSIITNAIIGNYVSIGDRVSVGLGKHPLDYASLHPTLYECEKTDIKAKNYFDENALVQIGHNVWIGTGVLVLSGVKIANGTIIAAGSFVNKSIDEPNTIWGGIPAKKLRTRCNRDEIDDSLWTKAHSDIYREFFNKKLNE